MLTCNDNIQLGNELLTCLHFSTVSQIYTALLMGLMMGLECPDLFLCHALKVHKRVQKTDSSILLRDIIGCDCLEGKASYLMCAKYKTLHTGFLVHMLDACQFVMAVVCCLCSV